MQRAPPLVCAEGLPEELPGKSEGRVFSACRAQGIRENFSKKVIDVANASGVLEARPNARKINIASKIKIYINTLKSIAQLPPVVPLLVEFYPKFRLALRSKSVHIGGSSVIKYVYPLMRITDLP